MNEKKKPWRQFIFQSSGRDSILGQKFLFVVILFCVHFTFLVIFFGVVSTKIKNVVRFSRFPTLSKVHQRPHQPRVKKKKKSTPDIPRNESERKQAASRTMTTTTSADVFDFRFHEERLRVDSNRDSSTLFPNGEVQRG